MNDIARLRAIVAFDIADSLRTLGLRDAAGVTRADTSTDTWVVISDAVRAMVTDHDRSAERRAVRAAALVMSGDDFEAAALIMAHLRDCCMTVDEYAAEVAAEAAEAAAAGVTL